MAALAVDPAVDALQAAGDARWLARLRAAEIESRMAQARVLQIVGEPDAAGVAGVAGRSGYCTVARMVAAVALIGSGEARNRVAAADALAPRQSLTGETTAGPSTPPLPDVSPAKPGATARTQVPR